MIYCSNDKEHNTNRGSINRLEDISSAIGCSEMSN